MPSLRPFFSFYGSKWRLAPKYPEPRYKVLIEPFAGSAGYALRYPDRRVILVERDPIVAGLWRWLISASPGDILSLPRLKLGDNLDDYEMPQEARWLMGFWINQTGARPNHVVTGFGQRCQRHERVAAQLSYIRHWTVIEGDYSLAPAIPATWFVDPPYQVEGKKYPYGPSQINYADLAAWCKSLSGQVIVCENEGAAWLPFDPFSVQRGAVYNGKMIYSKEVAWFHDDATPIALAQAA
jgi:hypothetical protein